MNRACISKNTNLHEQNQHASSIQPLKNNFVRMKKGRNILLNLSFLIVLFFLHGIDAQSNLDTQQYYIEISYNTDNIESRLTLDSDSSDEDQIDKYQIMYLSEQPECQKYGLSTMPLLNIQFFSVWQPPKVI
jgi:hypothetical protein